MQWLTHVWLKMGTMLKRWGMENTVCFSQLLSLRYSVSVYALYCMYLYMYTKKECLKLLHQFSVPSVIYCITGLLYPAQSLEKAFPQHLTTGLRLINGLTLRLGKDWRLSYDCTVNTKLFHNPVCIRRCQKCEWKLWGGFTCFDKVSVI